MANNMSNVNRETTRMFFCSRHWDGQSYLVHFYTFTVFFCVILTITATLGNSLILLALHKEESLHPPSKLLLRCLTVTDLSVGVIGQPAAITLLLSAINENWKLRLQQTQVQDTFGSQRGSISPNIARYKKAIINALWVHLNLATCYLPFAVIMTVSAVQ